MILFCACNAETSQNSTPKPKEPHTLKILALDLGKFNTMCCFFDTKTRKHSFLNAPTERNYLNTLLKKHKVDLVVMEACGPSGWITTGRQVSVYFGLVPRQYQSGETDRNGRITKRGNPLARTILVECAWATLLEAAYGLSVSVVEKE